MNAIVPVRNTNGGARKHFDIIHPIEGSDAPFTEKWADRKAKHSSDSAAEPKPAKYDRRHDRNIIDTPAFVDRLSRLWAEGMTWKGMCVNMDCAESTITRCRQKHPERFPNRIRLACAAHEQHNVVVRMPKALIERAGRRNHRRFLQLAAYMRKLVQDDLDRNNVQ